MTTDTKKTTIRYTACPWPEPIAKKAHRLAVAHVQLQMKANADRVAERERQLQQLRNRE